MHTDVYKRCKCKHTQILSAFLTILFQLYIMSLLKNWDRGARSTCSLLNAIIKSRYYKVHFPKRIKLKRFAENEEAGFLTRASLRAGVYATSIFAVTNFRVVSPRLSSSLFFFSCCHCGEFVLVLSRRRGVTIWLREGWRTLGHKFPSCSKSNRVELIHLLSF